MLVKSLTKISLFLFLNAIVFALIFINNANAADTIKEGSWCGTSGAYIWWDTDTKQYKKAIDYYKTQPGFSQDQTEVLCESGTECLPVNCTFTQAGTLGLIEYSCVKPNSSTVVLNDEQQKLCVQNKKDELKTSYDKVKSLEDCKQKAPKETGIFTKDISPECLGCGICSQKDVFQEFINIFTFILQISGSLAVLVMVVGGIMYMTAAGDQQKTGKAKAALTAAIIGLIIVLVAFTLITFVMNLLGYSNAGSWFSPTLQ